MSGAGETVRAALAARLRGQAELGGAAIFDGVRGGQAAAGVLPAIEIGALQAADWSATAMRGRELRTTMTVRVADGQRARLDALVAAVEQAGEAIPTQASTGDWRIVGAVFLRSRPVTQKGGGAAVAVEHRVRVVAI